MSQEAKIRIIKIGEETLSVQDPLFETDPQILAKIINKLLGQPLSLLCSVGTNDDCKDEALKAQIWFFYQLSIAGIIPKLTVLGADTLQRYAYLNDIVQVVRPIAKIILNLFKELQFAEDEASLQYELEKEIVILKNFQHSDRITDYDFLQAKIKLIRTLIENLPPECKNANGNQAHLHDLLKILDHFYLYMALQALENTLDTGNAWFKDTDAYIKKLSPPQGINETIEHLMKTLETKGFLEADKLALWRKQRTEFATANEPPVKILCWSDYFGIYSELQESLDRKQLAVLREAHKEELGKKDEKDLDEYEKGILQDSKYTAQRLSEEQEIIKECKDRLVKKYIKTRVKADRNYKRTDALLSDQYQIEFFERIQRLDTQSDDISFSQAADRCVVDYRQLDNGVRWEKTGFPLKFCTQGPRLYLFEEDILICSSDDMFEYPGQVTKIIGTVIDLTRTSMDKPPVNWIEVEVDKSALRNKSTSRKVVVQPGSSSSSSSDNDGSPPQDSPLRAGIKPTIASHAAPLPTGMEDCVVAVVGNIIYYVNLDRLKPFHNQMTSDCGSVFSVRASTSSAKDTKGRGTQPSDLHRQTPNDVSHDIRTIPPSKSKVQAPSPPAKQTFSLDGK